MKINNDVANGSQSAVVVVRQKARRLWCRLNIRYVNAWSHNSSYILEAQLYLGNEAISHKYNKKLIRKAREVLTPIYFKWKNQIETEGIKCATA